MEARNWLGDALGMLHPKQYSAAVGCSSSSGVPAPTPICDLKADYISFLLLRYCLWFTGSRPCKPMPHDHAFTQPALYMTF